jgi:hypothetical protein
MNDAAEREFFLTMRRQFIGTIRALEAWHGASRRDSVNAKFTQALRTAFIHIVRAIDERYEVGTKEPKERSLTG